MATWYVDSTASGTGAGTSWANACLTMAAAIALASPGDDFDMYFGHAETTASALTLTFPGTAAAPCRVFSCDRTNSPAQGTDLVAGFACTGSVTSNVLTLTALSVIGTSTTALPAVGNWVTIGSTGATAQITSITTPWNGTTGVYAVTMANAVSGAVSISGASITTTGASAITLTFQGYMYGVTLNCGTGASAANLSIGSMLGSASAGKLFLNTCSLKLLTTATTSALVDGTSGYPVGARVELINTTATFSNASQKINMGNGTWAWKDTQSAILGTAPSALLSSSSGNASSFEFYGCDLSAISSGNKIFSGGGQRSAVYLNNCKLASGVVVTSSPTGPLSGLADLVNCDSGATGYRQERYRYEGTLTADATVVKSGGASDDVTPISWKVVTTANAKRQSPFECFEIVQWVDTTGTSHTATIDVITDTAIDATLTNADVWVEAQVLDNASYPIASLYTSAPANQLTAGTTLTTSSATWTTTGLTTPKPQKMSVTFTNQIKGYVRFVVKVGRASLATLRVDPSVTIT